MNGKVDERAQVGTNSHRIRLEGLSAKGRSRSYTTEPVTKGRSICDGQNNWPGSFK